jgi:polyadenylate-binding protein
MSTIVAPTQQPPVAAVTQAVPQQPGTQSSSLYVGDLLPEITEAALFDIFNAVGPVASVRVCRDAISRRSLGYAYVNFQNSADADRALDTMNFEPIGGKMCRIMWCQRDPTVRRSGVGNIFVKGLDKSIDNKALYDAFSIFGNILSVKVVTDATGNSVGRGFVHFENAEDASEAIDKADGTLLKDKKINVAPFKSRKERLEEHGRSENQFKNVFVKNLGDTVDQAALITLFSKFGEVTSSCVAEDDKNPGKYRGFGFVAFADSESAKRAVEELHDKEFNGNKLFVGRAMKKAERAAQLRREHEARHKELQQRSRGVNLYVKNLAEEFDDAKIRTTFEEFGNITSARVMRDEKGTSRGFGFVCFSTQEEATRASTDLNGRIILGKPLYVALAQPKEERRAQLSVQYRQRMQFQRQPGFIPQPNMYAPQQMMYIGGPVPNFGRGQPQFFGQRGPNQPRFGQQFLGQAGFPQQMQRQPRPQGSYPRPSQSGPRPNTRYSNQARNMPLNQPMIPAAAPVQLPHQGSQQLTSMLAASDPERQKQLLGDALYPLVAERFPQAAGKLTGMLLQMDNSEILHLLEDHVTLQQELEKANEVLRAHMTQ